MSKVEIGRENMIHTANQSSGGGGLGRSPISLAKQNSASGFKGSEHPLTDESMLGNISCVGAEVRNTTKDVT